MYLGLRLVEKCERVARIPAQLGVVPKRRYDCHSDLGRDKNWIGQRRVFIPWYSQDNCEIAESIKDNHGLFQVCRVAPPPRDGVDTSTRTSISGDTNDATRSTCIYSWARMVGRKKASSSNSKSTGAKQVSRGSREQQTRPELNHSQQTLLDLFPKKSAPVPIPQEVPVDPQPVPQPPLPTPPTVDDGPSTSHPSCYDAFYSLL